LRSLDTYARIEVLYWLHLCHRDLVLQSSANDSAVHGTFSPRSPVRPNPIGAARSG
jgi:tRNA (Thr-GGU) A37 N-methylase